MTSINWMKFEHIGGNFQHGQKSTIWANLNLNTLWGKKIGTKWMKSTYGWIQVRHMNERA